MPSPVPSPVPKQYLKSPEAFLETVPPVGTSETELLAARAEIQKRFGHTTGFDAALAMQPERPRLAVHSEAPVREANPKVPNAPVSGSGWLYRLFR